MIEITDTISIGRGEVEMHAIRSQGAGGQSVNKVSTAIHLRFDIAASSLPDDVKQRLLQSHDSRISGDGILVIKAGRLKSQEKNRQDALERLRSLIKHFSVPPKRRKKTRPSRASVERRLVSKAIKSRKKFLRSNLDH